MALTQAEEDALRAILAERTTRTAATRMLGLEHRRMAGGRTALTAQENVELDAHLAAREAAGRLTTKRG